MSVCSGRSRLLSAVLSFFLPLYFSPLRTHGHADQYQPPHDVLPRTIPSFCSRRFCKLNARFVISPSPSGVAALPYKVLEHSSGRGRRKAVGTSFGSPFPPRLCEFMLHFLPLSFSSFFRSQTAAPPSPRPSAVLHRHTALSHARLHPLLHSHLLKRRNGLG